MKPRKIPLRKCVACQQMMAKKELIRVVRTPEGELLIDLKGKRAGRGAYLCGKVECFKLAKKAKSLDRALKQTVGEEIYDELQREFISVQDAFIASRDEIDDDEA
ncbi:hypothetical protein PAECIP111893_00968 [Paenibacillus plantiphilus]|uniref:YlxR domain-containing protein n=1 Tax=Paenibacillus plantiphilus TaxID=2905650 RepID=A0ABM9BYB9_9BACL|nr:YlxR family protein [Paenibacillus plantiphilus]CAH1197782.1 hypothetical protein PAECIP111893_00968 [Paenibacillus plantiphilus]